MKRHAPKIIVGLVVIVLAFALRDRRQLPQTPEAAASEFFDASARGDDDRCLRLVAGQLRTSLEATRRELGVDAFRASLERSTSGIKGLAVSRRGDAPADRVALDIEIVFADRNEHQRKLLAQERSGWTIVSIEEASRVEPPIPYGTPVFETPTPTPGGDARR